MHHGIRIFKVSTLASMNKTANGSSIHSPKFRLRTGQMWTGVGLRTLPFHDILANIDASPFWCDCFRSTHQARTTSHNPSTQREWLSIAPPATRSICFTKKTSFPRSESSCSTIRPDYAAKGSSRRWTSIHVSIC